MRSTIMTLTLVAGSGHGLRSNSRRRFLMACSGKWSIFLAFRVWRAAECEAICLTVRRPLTIGGQ